MVLVSPRMGLCQMRERGDALGVVRMVENRGADDEQIGHPPATQRPIVSAFTPPSTSSSTSGPTWPASWSKLVQGHRLKRLAAKAGCDAHRQNQVANVQAIFDGRERRGGVVGQAGHRPQRAELFQQRPRIVDRLDVERDRCRRRPRRTVRHSGAGSEIIRCASIGRSVTRRTASTIGRPYEMFGTKLAVHHVQVQAAHPGGFQPVDFIGQVPEIAQQQRGDHRRRSPAQRGESAATSGLWTFHDCRGVGVRVFTRPASGLVFHFGVALQRAPRLPPGTTRLIRGRGHELTA